MGIDISSSVMDSGQCLRDISLLQEKHITATETISRKIDGLQRDPVNAEIELLQDWIAEQSNKTASETKINGIKSDTTHLRGTSKQKCIPALLT